MVGLGPRACFSLHIKVHNRTMNIFLRLRAQSMFPTISISMIQWKIPRLPLCWLRKHRGCNQSSGCFRHNPLCLSLQCFPIKGALITGNSAGNGAGRWEVGMEKEEQTRLSKNKTVASDVVLNKERLRYRMSCSTKTEIRILRFKW